MGKLGRRFLVPFVVGGLVAIALLMVWTIWGDEEVSVGLRDLALAALFILPFQAAGLALLLPIALLLRDLSLPKSIYPVVLAVVGAVLGIVVVLPLSEGAHLLDLALPATCGASSALVWWVFNQDAMKGRA